MRDEILQEPARPRARGDHPSARQMAWQALRASRAHLRGIWPVALVPVLAAVASGLTSSASLRAGAAAVALGPVALLVGQATLLLWVSIYVDFATTAWAAIVGAAADRGEHLRPTRVLAELGPCLGALAMLTTRFFLRAAAVGLLGTVIFGLVVVCGSALVFGGLTVFAGAQSPTSMEMGGVGAATAVLFWAPLLVLWWRQWVSFLSAPVHVVRDRMTARQAISTARAWSVGRRWWLTGSVGWLFLPAMICLLVFFIPGLVSSMQLLSSSSGLLAEGEAAKQFAEFWRVPWWKTAIATGASTLVTPARALLPSLAVASSGVTNR